MISLTKKTDYGMELVTFLAKNYKTRPIPLREIARERRLSFKFLEQAAIPLRKKGLIDAKEGTGGGYFLKKNPQKISVVEIIEVLESNLRAKNCQRCPRESFCFPKTVWRNMEKVLRKEMNKKVLADLI